MKDHSPSVKSEAYTQDDLMHSQESPPTIGTLVKNHLDEMASGIHTAHTSRRERFSYKRLQPVLGFTPVSFSNGKVFSKWLSEQFYPRMVHLRVEKGLAIESLRENCGHLAKWMLLHGVSAAGDRPVQGLREQQARPDVEVARSRTVARRRTPSPA